MNKMSFSLLPFELQELITKDYDILNVRLINKTLLHLTQKRYEKYMIHTINDNKLLPLINYNHPFTLYMKENNTHFIYEYDICTKLSCTKTNIYKNDNHLLVFNRNIKMDYLSKYKILTQLCQYKHLIKEYILKDIMYQYMFFNYNHKQIHCYLWLYTNYLMINPYLLNDIQMKQVYNTKMLVKFIFNYYKEI